MIKKIAIFFSVLLFSAPALADALHTKAQLYSQYESAQPGAPIPVAVLLEHEDGWHSYWENPGDAGIPTSLTWTLPDGFIAGNIRWPSPQLLNEGPLTVYAYHGSVVLPVIITPPASVDAASIPIKVKAEWLVCKEICIPESAEMEITLPVSKEAPAPSMYASLFEDNSKFPTAFPEKGEYAVSGKQLIVSVPRTISGAENISSAHFFPRTSNIILYAAKQTLAVDNERLSLTIDRADEMPQGEQTGLLMVNEQFFDVTLTPGKNIPVIAPATKTSEPSPKDYSFFAIMLFAVTGGLILNLMPCVLPVLSLKALAIVKKSGHAHAHVAKLGVAYTLGIMLSFAVIAGILIGLQQAGEAVGWGYQMQSPAFVGFLIYLLFLVGLNLSGKFDLPVLLGNVGGEMANESSARGSFFTGVLATAVATPCTAPFMASAVGVALTLPAWQAMLVFEALGFGLALPFLLISIFPRLLKFLPKPGAWMETFKKFLAVPMYVSVVWLLWVLMMQSGAGGVAIAILGMALIFAIVHLRHKVASIAFIVLLAISLPLMSSMEKIGIAMHEGSIPYSKKTLETLRAQGTPVFVDATAAWCLTCQVNAKVAIKTQKTMQLFKDKGVALMVADWTRRDDDISAWLMSFGYAGVPLYVYYPPHGEPKVLPQLLSEEIIANTISGD